MTLPPEKIGDKGQRYAASLNGWPLQGQWNEFAFGNDFERMAETCSQMKKTNPSVVGYKIKDRDDEAQPDYVIGEVPASQD